MAIIDGTPNNDTMLYRLYGTDLADIINGFAGDDELLGNAGDDVLDGGDGDDLLIGGTGRDRYIGGAGNDVLIEAYSGSPTLESDEYFGGDGDDYLYDFGGSDLLDGGAGNDTISIYSDAGKNRILGGDGDDIIGIHDADLGYGLGVDTATGGAGRDTFHVSAYGVDRGVKRGVDIITDFQTGPGGDKINLDDVLYYVWGRKENPFLTGHIRLKQSGADTLFQVDYDGFASAHKTVTLLKLKNVDASTFTVDNFTHHTRAIASFAPDDVGLTITGTSASETLNGTESSDIISGANGNDTIYGHYGNDVIDGGSGKNIIYGGSGSDTITGGSSVDKLYGNGDGNFPDSGDIIDGGAGNDILDGGDGGDTLRGGKGVDTIYASSGIYGDGDADIIIFAAGDTGKTLTKADHILNFEGGIDTIDLSEIDAIAATAGVNDAFTFVGTAAFTGVAGQLRYDQTGGTTRVVADMTGDGLADLMIVLDNLVALTADDFAL